VSSKENRSHKNGSLNLGVIFGVSLGHDTTKGVSGHEDVITFETGSLELAESLRNVMIHKNGLGNITLEFGNTNPNFLALLGTGFDVSLSDGGVSRVLAFGSVDPNDSNWGTFGGFSGRQNNGVSHSDS